MTRKHSEDIGFIDMDRLSRIFTWLTAGIITLLLGMAFDQAIFADATQLATFSRPGVPYTMSYPAGWSAAFDRGHDLIAKNASTVAGASDTLLVLNDSPITQVTGVGEGYLVTFGKIRSDERAPYEAILNDATATAIPISGATKAVQKTGLSLNSGIETEVVMTVGSDLYVMELLTTRGTTDVSTNAATVLASLKFTQ